MNNFKKYIPLIGFLFILKAGFCQSGNISDGGKKLDRLLKIIDNRYVDTTNQEELVEDAIVEVLKQLDPHSVYIPKEELEKMNEPLVGNFEGIGIQYNILNDTLTVVSPISGGPSEKVGIRAGDKIVGIDGENVAGIKLQNSDVQSKLRGKKGTKVDVAILRRDVKDLLSFTITRDKIPIYSVDACFMATEDIGYIKVNRFAKNTAEEFVRGLGKLKQQNMKHLIIDLKGNGGGYLRTAIKIADELLSEKKLIVFTEGVKSIKQEYYTTTPGNFEKGKLVVLINEGSASASEIVSGAIQDYDRGLIIGRRSFGKGLVQKPFNLTDGSAIRLTVSRYYTPSGRSIQRPYTDGKEAYYKEFTRRFENGEYMTEDSISFPDSLKYQTLNRKRTVYGGGGIMPDYFIPLDTTFSTDYFGEVNRKGLLNDFSLTYMNEHREELKAKYAKLSDFKAQFDVEKEFLSEFIAYAEKNGVEENKEEIETSKKILVLRLKALIARSLWDTSAYYEIVSALDDSFQRAIELINDNTFNKEKLIYK